MTAEWVVDERFPMLTLRMAFTNLLDISSPLTQALLMYLSTQASSETDRIRLEKLAKVLFVKPLKLSFNLCL